MPINVLVVGNDLTVQKLIVDILEITLKDIQIDKVTDVEGMYSTFEKEDLDYKLIVVDCFNSKKVNEEILSSIRKNYPSILQFIIVIFESLEEKPDDGFLHDIPYVIKPFSLDTFGELVKKKCLQ